MPKPPTIDDFKLARQQVELRRGKIRLALDERKLADARKAEEEEAAADDEADGRYCATLAALAKRFGISRETWRKLVREPDAPQRHGAKGYAVKDWGLWLLRRRQSTSEEVEERNWRIRYLKAQAEHKELLNAERARKVIPIAEHEQSLRDFGKAIGDAADALRDRVAIRTTAPELLAAAEETVIELKHEIAQRVQG